ncbi:MAG: class II aldolase [Ruminococcaceae bacterium]|nr:class II aldolase [Oscillospiraceae bacterium]
MYTEQLKALAAMSNKYGSDPAYVLAGGGNTSFKSDKNLWVKGSGTSLATIRPEDFVVLERSKLDEMWNASYPEEEKAREAAVLADMMAARIEGENRRPSVETLLHNLFPQKYILHVHPTTVNGITCSKEGKAAMERLFPDAVWVDACKPGYILALECKTMMDAYKAAHGKDVDLLFLQNHGIFFAADTAEEVGALAERTMAVIAGAIRRWPDEEALAVDLELAGKLGVLYGGVCVPFANREILNYDPATESLSPDHIVYAKAQQLAVAPGDDLAAAFAAFEAANGYKPKIIFVRGVGMFACGMSEKEAVTAGTVMFDAVKVVCYAESFGGVQPMPQFLIDFIVNWEVESYRSSVQQK